MKRFIGIVCGLMLVASALFAAPGAVTISTNSIRVLPPAGVNSASALWTTNTTYANGQMVYSTGGGVYMCLVGGASYTGAVPPAAVGDITDGTVTWRRAFSRLRLGLAIVNDGTGVVYVAVDTPAVYGQGIRLNPNGGSVVFSGTGVQQVFLSAICGITNGTLSTLEW